MAARETFEWLDDHFSFKAALIAGFIAFIIGLLTTPPAGTSVETGVCFFFSYTPGGTNPWSDIITINGSLPISSLSQGPIISAVTYGIVFLLIWGFVVGGVRKATMGATRGAAENMKKLI